MTTPANISPRIASRKDVAALLSMSKETFRNKLPELTKSGFPDYDNLLGGFDLKAVNQWMDIRAGIEMGKPIDSADAEIIKWRRKRAG